MKDVLELLCDRYDISILVDPGAFKKRGKGSVDEKPIKLPAQTAVPLDSVLKSILKQVDATYQVRDGVILVVPLKNETS